MLGREGQRGDEVLVGGPVVALPAQRPAQGELRGGQLGPVRGGRGDADGGAQRTGGGGVLTEPDEGPAVHDLGRDQAGGVRGQQFQRLLGQPASLDEVRGGRLGGAVVEQALAELGAQLAETGGRAGDDDQRVAVLGVERVGLRGGGDRGLVRAALVVQRQRHQLEVGEHAGERAEGVHEQRGRRQRRVQQAGRLDRLVHGGVDATREQLDARVAGQPGGALQVVVGRVERGLGRADQR